MKNLIYFSDTQAAIKPKFQVNPDGSIVGDALLFYEGSHQDMMGVSHVIPRERLLAIAKNTNKRIGKGKTVPLLKEHNLSVFGADGEINQFGKLTSLIDCRPITKADIDPKDSKLKNLVGKLGAFAQVHIVGNVDRVKNKTIKALSAGIDPIKNRIEEVSAVQQPALVAARLLFSRAPGAANFSAHGMTDYNAAKQSIDAWQKPYDELFKFFEIFAGTIQAIEYQGEEEAIAANIEVLKQTALEQYVDDLMEYLDIKYEPEDVQQGNIYGNNPYDQQMIVDNGQGKALAGFSATKEKWADAAQANIRNKRKRRG